MAGIGSTFHLAGAALRDAVTGRLGREYIGPRRIRLRSHVMESGLACRIAADLVTQHAAADGTVWATRGYHLYRLSPSQDTFRRQARLPCPAGRIWLGRFSFLRKHLHRSDVVDVFDLRSGAVLVFAGGWICRRGARHRRWERVLKLRYWGPGVGRGVRPLGMSQLPSGEFLFGEYFANPDNRPVRIYASADDGRSWQVRHEFPAGRTRHVHALQVDPVTGAVWVCTGDHNDMSFIAFSDDAARSFQQIGTGSQQWRTCKLLFTDRYVYWGADTNHPEHRAIFRWRRADRTVEKLARVCGPVLGGTRLARGTFVLATDREGTAGLQWVFQPGQQRQCTEPDEIPSLWVSLDGREWKRLKVGRWLPQARPVFGIPQIAVGHGAPVLAVSCFNIERYNGKLLVIPEQELRRWYQQQPAPSPESVGRHEPPGGQM